MTPGTVLILGGTSDIGRATALAFAERGWAIQLAGRDVEALQREADDIPLRARRTVPISLHAFDALDTATFKVFVDRLEPLPDVAVSVVGLLGDQRQAETDPAHAATVLRTNFEGPALALGLLADRLVARGSGVIVGVSSVAGERGRGSNYVYGSAKAGFTAYLSGLRNRLSRTGVHVVTVNPGFVRTRMTAGLDLPGPLTAEPREVAERIVAAVERRRDVVYVRPVWAFVMAVIRAIPERVFKRLKL